MTNIGPARPRTAKLVFTVSSGVASGVVLALVLYACTLSAAPSALALPEGRHYEMVSPAYKGGYGVFHLIGPAVTGAGEGDSLGFESFGAFAGTPNIYLWNDYVARRGAGGWSTEPMMVPAGLLPEERPIDVSLTLERSLYSGDAGPNGAIAKQKGEVELAVQDQSSGGNSNDFASMPLKRLDGKPLEIDQPDIAGGGNFCHVMFTTVLGGEQFDEALLPEARGTESDLYELSMGAPGCGEGAGLRLVAVTNKVKPGGEHEPLDPHCLAFLGVPPFNSSSSSTNRSGIDLYDVSADGNEAFFETNLDLAKPECDGNDMTAHDPAVLFVRLAGQHTLEISTPIAADCEKGALCYKAIEEHAAFKAFAGQERAIFEGANEAGTRAFFTTAQPLVTGDADTGNDVYMASIGCPAGNPECSAPEREVTSLVQVSHSRIAGEASDVQNVVVSAPDGERVYYVAQGVVTDEAGPEGRHAVKGADNLYVYDAEGGSTKFIAELCSGPGRSGAAEDQYCPSGPEAADLPLWRIRGEAEGQEGEAQTAGAHGRFMVFNSVAQLTRGDTDSTRDVYLYDAFTGDLVRVSVGEEGYDANGNSDAFGAELPGLGFNGSTAANNELNDRAISEDGSRVVFETSEPLSPKALNGLANVYEWHDGKVALVSSGTGDEPVGGPGKVTMTPSGRDIFFMTDQALVPQDPDEAIDVYDARLGEGFRPFLAGSAPCSGDACQGPLTNPAPLLVPGSVSQAAGENIARPGASPKKVRRKQSSRHKAKRGRRRPGRRKTKAKGRARGAISNSGRSRR